MGDERAGSNRGAVLVPVKAFERAKGRLSTALGEQSRSDLARQMATHVVRAQGDLDVAIACDDDTVASWARSLGARVVWCPGTDLNGAVAVGFATLRDHGYDSVAIAHSDLPFAASLGRLLGWPGVTVVPDRHRAGTNVLVVPTAIDYSFSYGEGSLVRHVAEGVKHRRGLRIVHDVDLAWDIDHPDDLRALGTGTFDSIGDDRSLNSNESDT